MDRQAGKEDEGLRKRRCEAAAYMGLVQHMAKRMYEYIPKEMPWEDVLQYGYIGLVEAVTRYDVGKGKFSTFAGIRIYGSIIDGVFQFMGVKRHRKEGRLKLRGLQISELKELHNTYERNRQAENEGDEWTETILDKLSLEQALQYLRPEERDLIDACYFQQKSWTDYAQEKFVNAEWVYLTHRRVLKKLRKRLKS